MAISFPGIKKFLGPNLAGFREPKSIPKRPIGSHVPNNNPKKVRCQCRAGMCETRAGTGIFGNFIDSEIGFA
jgi:hypothetical protein